MFQVLRENRKIKLITKKKGKKNQIGKLKNKKIQKL